MQLREAGLWLSCPWTCSHGCACPPLAAGWLPLAVGSPVKPGPRQGAAFWVLVILEDGLGGIAWPWWELGKGSSLRQGGGCPLRLVWAVCPVLPSLDFHPLQSFSLRPWRAGRGAPDFPSAAPSPTPCWRLWPGLWGRSLADPAQLPAPVSAPSKQVFPAGLWPRAGGWAAHCQKGVLKGCVDAGVTQGLNHNQPSVWPLPEVDGCWGLGALVFSCTEPPDGCHLVPVQNPDVVLAPPAVLQAVRGLQASGLWVTWFLRGQFRSARVSPGPSLQPSFPRLRAQGLVNAGWRFLLALHSFCPGMSPRFMLSSAVWGPDFLAAGSCVSLVIDGLEVGAQPLGWGPCASWRLLLSEHQGGGGDSGRWGPAGVRGRQGNQSSLVPWACSLTRKTKYVQGDPRGQEVPGFSLLTVSDRRARLGLDGLYEGSLRGQSVGHKHFLFIKKNYFPKWLKFSGNNTYKM